jgi:hypothetical protein
MSRLNFGSKLWPNLNTANSDAVIVMVFDMKMRTDQVPTSMPSNVKWILNHLAEI